MQFLTRYSLRTILITSILTLALLPLLIVTANAWRIAGENANEKATLYASAAKNLADKIDRNLFERYGDVQAFGLNHAVRDRDAWYAPSDQNPIVQAMNSYVDTYDIYYLTLLVDLDGNVISVNTRDQDGDRIDTKSLYDVNFSDQEWFADTLSGNYYESDDGSFSGTVVEHLHIDPYVESIYQTEGLALGFSAPVYDEQGEVIAVWKNVTKFDLVEDIVLDCYQELKVQGTPSAEVTLLDCDGNVIIDCDPSKTGAERIRRDLEIIGKFNLAEKNVAAAQRVVEGESGTLMQSWHARKKIHQVAGFAPLTGALGFPGMEWNVLVRVPEDEAFATSLSAKTATIITSVVFAVVIVFFVVWFSRSASRTLSDTVESMESAASGDFTKKVFSTLSLDVARMTKSLNEMLDELATAEKNDFDFRSQIEAISRSQGVIEFDMEGRITNANEQFLSAVGYRLEELKGQDYSLLVDEEYAKSADHQQFWLSLHDGQFFAGEFQLRDKDGNEVWIQASYNSIADKEGQLTKVVTYASVTTDEKKTAVYNQGQLDAINRSQAVIEFELDGTIINANENFLTTVGYGLDEIVGKHHRIFVDTEYGQSAEYKEFWKQLGNGEAITDEFCRVAKDGSEVWLRASYNGILDANGHPASVVKYAVDITEAKTLELQVHASQEQERRSIEEQKQKVTELLEVVNQVADGDLSVAIPQLGEDSIGKVASGIADLVQSIRSVLVQVQGVSATVASSAAEMASTSEQFSSGAQQQAASLEETAASLEEITSAVKLNTDNSQQAQQLSMSSRETAESGGIVVGDAIEAMTAINQSSKKIAEIISTIDEIAFQTNLLALNAAVEAARAGEQGRGFAVVASEVRNLAQRSAGAAKEIKTLIQDSVEKVENGTDLVNKSGNTLQEIVTSVKRVADIVSEISAASTEQLTGIEQTNGAVSQMDRVTQSNAAQTEEMSCTAQSLTKHAGDLRDLLGKFRLGEETIDFEATARAAAPEVSIASVQATPHSAVDVNEFPVSNDKDEMHELDLIGVGPDRDFDEF